MKRLEPWCKCKTLRTIGALNFPVRWRDGFAIITEDGTQHARDVCKKPKDTRFADSEFAKVKNRR